MSYKSFFKFKKKSTNYHLFNEFKNDMPYLLCSGVT